MQPRKLYCITHPNVVISRDVAVGTLLYCHLAAEPIARRWDQPPNGGGNYYRFTLSPRAAHALPGTTW
jgi:hypothetical protein